MNILSRLILFCAFFSQIAHSQNADAIRVVSPEEFLIISHRHSDVEVAAKQYLDSARIARLNHDNFTSVYFLSIAERLAENTSDDTLKAEIANSFGKSYKNLHLLEESIRYYLQAIDQFIIIKDTVNLANSYNRIGIVYKEAMQYIKAVQAFNQANLFFYQLNDSTGIGLVKLNIGNVFKNTGRQDLAKKEYFNALEIFEKLNDQVNMANCFNNIGNVYKNLELYDSAFYFMYRTVSIRKQTDADMGLAYIYHNLSNLHLKLGNTDSSLHYISCSFEIKQRLNNQVEMALDYEVFGRIYMEKSLWNMAIDNFEKALELLAFIPEESIQNSIRRSLGYSYFKKGDYEKAAQNLISFLELEDSIGLWNDASSIEDEFIRYRIVTDSIASEQLILERELQEAKNDRQALENEIREKNLFYIILIFIIVFVALAIILISFRRRLQQTRKHEAILTAQNEELKRTLISKEEKEILLKEVHHRVKNNLQIINSLIRLQSNYMNSANFKEKLIETENRIRSMALIHEKLYKSDNLAKLSVRNYIEELSINILDSYESNTRIKLNLDIEENEYGIDSLIPIGLIINEALSNSIKHAFFERKEGMITIKFYTNSSTHLYISDNGLGADMTFEELKEDSLGMELIESLTDQLDGTMTLDTTNGFIYDFKFPILK